MHQPHNLAFIYSLISVVLLLLQLKFTSFRAESTEPDKASSRQLETARFSGCSEHCGATLTGTTHVRFTEAPSCPLHSSITTQTDLNHSSALSPSTTDSLRIQGFCLGFPTAVVLSALKTSDIVSAQVNASRMNKYSEHSVTLNEWKVTNVYLIPRPKRKEVPK